MPSHDGDPVRRRQAHPPLPEALHDEGAGRRSCRWTADDSYSRVRSKQTSRSGPPTTRATNDERPSARRRATVERDVADVDELERARPAACAASRAWPAARRSGAPRPRGRGGGGRSPARSAAAPSRSSSTGSQMPSSSSSWRSRSSRRPWASSSRGIGVTASSRCPDRTDVPHLRSGEWTVGSFSAIGARDRRPDCDVSQRIRISEPVHEPGRVAAQPGDHLGDLGRAGDVVELGRARRRASRTSSVTQPVSVTGGWTTLAVIPNGASSARRRHRVVLECRLGRAVGHLLREARSDHPRSARRCAPTSPRVRGGGAPARRSAGRRRGRRRRGCGRSSPPAPRPAPARGRRSGVGANVSACHPLALLTRIDTGPSWRSASSNTIAAASRAVQVDLDRDSRGRAAARSWRARRPRRLARSTAVGSRRARDRPRRRGAGRSPGRRHRRRRGRRPSPRRCRGWRR